MLDFTTPSSNSDTVFTAARFADNYKDMPFTGKKVTVLINVEDSQNLMIRQKGLKKYLIFKHMFLIFIFC